MSYDEAIKFLNICLDKNSKEYSFYLLGNDKLEKAISVLLKHIER